MEQRTTSKQLLSIMRPIQMQHVLLLFFLLLISSCVPHKKLVTFGEEIDQIDLRSEAIMQRADIRIQPNDILHIAVYGQDEEAIAPFNIRQNQQQLNQVNQQSGLLLQGYLVSTEGYIEFPVIGPVKVGGLNREEAKELIRSLLLQYLKEPTVELRYMNFRVNILGEVNSPGTYTFPQENVTLLEALARSGDFTTLANRENVLIIRTVENQRELTRINMLSTDIFNSPYFYLQQNDVIYVEPLEAKTAATPGVVLRYASLIAGLTGLIAFSIQLFKP